MERGLFKKYVEYFHTLKLWNSKHYNQSECDEMNKSFEEVGLDISIRSEETQNNPGLKKMSKHMIKNQWGKTAHIPVMTK